MGSLLETWTSHKTIWQSDHWNQEPQGISSFGLGPENALLISKQHVLLEKKYGNTTFPFGGLCGELWRIWGMKPGVDGWGRFSIWSTENDFLNLDDVTYCFSCFLANILYVGVSLGYYTIMIL